MAGRAHQTEGVVEPGRSDLFDRFHDATGGAQRGFPRIARDDRIRIDVAATAGDEVAHPRNVVRGMNELEGGLVSGRGLPDVQATPDAGVLQPSDYRSEAIRPLGMSRAGIVPQERL
jgi:hypothetical protein